MIQEEYNVELKSDEYNEIIGAIPPVIVRYGIGILLAVLLFMIVLSTKIHYRTYIACPVFIEQEFSSGKFPVYKITFQLKPKDIAFINKGQYATIYLLQYPSFRFGNLNIIIHPENIKYVTNNGVNYYMWSQEDLRLISDKNIPLKYLDGLQGEAKIITGEETVAHKLTQSIRSTVKINF
jgi:hypothetical protein